MNENTDINTHENYSNSNAHLEVPTMKVIPLKKICMTIGELPTAYVETMTYYEMLLWFIGYLRDNIIPVVNGNGEAVQELQNVVMSLQNYINDFKDSIDEDVENLETYINNYFDNLDVQEEINNKLDQMLEDGTLSYLIGQFLNSFGINVISFNAKGDGETDDTQAIQDALDYAVTNNISIIYFPEGNYKITDGFTIEKSNLTIKGYGDVKLIYYGNGIDTNIFDISGTSGDDYLENITIDNIGFDGTNQEYKGGSSDSTPLVTSPNPLHRGIRFVFGNFIKNIKVTNCNLKEIYGEGIILRYCNQVYVANNILNDVSSGNIVGDGFTGYDNHGDGIACFFSYNCNIENNTILNTRTYLENYGTITAINKLCGRSGLEYEYAPNANSGESPDDPSHNPPGYEDIPKNTSHEDENLREGGALRFTNNFVQGYTKGIHIESKEKTIITNNSLVGNYINLLYTTNAEQVCSGNYLNTYNVGSAPQAGYDIYSGNIAITQYTSGEPVYGITISNNVINGDNKGITLGRSYVNIINNRINSRYAVYTSIENLTDINISNNAIFNYYETDNDTAIYFYGTKACNINNNLIYASTHKIISFRCDNSSIANNIFTNISIYGVNSPKDCNITNNKFSATIDITNTNKAFIYGDGWQNLTINTNVFNLSNITGSRAVYINGNPLPNYNIFGNRFTLNNNQSLSDIMFFGTLKNPKIMQNTFINDSVASNIYCINIYSLQQGSVTDNTETNFANYVIYCTGSGGNNYFNHNVGQMNVGGSNGSLNRFNQYYIQKGEIIVNYSMPSNASLLGWVCKVGGVYTTTTWTTNTSYTAGTYIKNSSNNVYKVITGGTATDEPTSTSSSEFTTLDGLKWLYCGPIATFGEININ